MALNLTVRPEERNKMKSKDQDARESGVEGLSEKCIK